MTNERRLNGEVIGDSVSGPSPRMRDGSFIDCELRRQFAWRDDTRLFSSVPLHDPLPGFKAQRERWAAANARAAQPDDEIWSTDTVDTVERRQVGPFVSRHIRTTKRTEYGRLGARRTNVEEMDGWYIDLPVNCND